MNNTDNNTICNSECLTGCCPFKKCVKYLSVLQNKNLHFNMQILSSGKLNMRMNMHKTGFGIAVDLGTTTIAAGLYNMQKAECVAEICGVNAQVIYGRDVIARIRYCEEHADGKKVLQSVLAVQLNEIVCALINTAYISASEISEITVCANTVMSYLLAGIEPGQLGVYPFKMTSDFGEVFTCDELGIDLNADCYIAPCISAFVGGDIVCGLLAVDFYGYESASFMDIGTNGEVAVISDNNISVASAAAGPAFEGACISCGMGAAPGAIYNMDIKNGKFEYKTIDNKYPMGITGSGLIDAVSSFLKIGAIDKSGKINSYSPFASKFEGEERLYVAPHIYLTQKDIREFQTAKGAIAAALLTLMDETHYTANLSNELFLAGGFGNYMDITSAQAVGLIPAKSNAHTAGNAAQKGVGMLLIDDTYKQRAKELAKKAHSYNLAENVLFMDNYIKCMELSPLL